MPLPSRSSGAQCRECSEAGKSRVELAHHAAATKLFRAARSGARLRDDAFETRRTWTVDMLIDTALGGLVIEYDGAYWHRAEAKVLVDQSKSRDLLAAGYHVARLREDDLPALDIDHPRYREFRAYSAAPRPQELIEAVGLWVSERGS
jgi:very-short-patch-repair endonuclease